jgi:hypothetical protein
VIPGEPEVVENGHHQDPIPLFVHLGQRSLCELDRLPRLAGEIGAPCRTLQHFSATKVSAADRRPIPELEDPGVLEDGFSMCQLADRQVAGDGGRRQPSIGVPCFVPLMGELGDEVGVRQRLQRCRFERLGDRGMEPSALAGDRVAIDRLLEERVMEAKSLARVLRLEDVRGNSLAEGVRKRHLVQGARPLKDRVRGDSSGDGCQPQNRLRGIAESGASSDQRLADRVRKLGSGVADGNELLREEGVALRPRVDRGHAGVRGRSADDRREQLAKLVELEWLEVDP